MFFSRICSFRRPRLFRRPAHRCEPAFRGELRFETLESRVVLTVFYPSATAADGDPGSLRDAVQQANDTPGPHTIFLDPGTYALTKTAMPLSEDLNQYGDLDVIADVSIVGAGAAVTTIDASAIPGHRVLELQFGYSFFISGVTITGGSTPGGAGGGIRNRGNLLLTNSTITGNASYFGGGIQSDAGSQLTVVDSLLTNNTGSLGGAIYTNAYVNDDVGLTVIDSVFSDNTANANGGAIGIASFATAEVRGSTFTNNSAPTGDGGAIYCQGNGTIDLHSLTVFDSTFTDNSSLVAGGAVQVRGGHEAQIDDSTFANNSSGQGGAIRVQGILHVEDSTFNGNTATANTYATGAGGAIVAELNSETTIVNSTISGNSADKGGGIHADNGTVDLTNTTITLNTAAGSGGGVAVQNATFEFVNTIVADNTAASGPDGWASGAAAVVSGGHNLLGIDAGFNFTPASGDLIGTTVMPLDARLGPLQYNGGPTRTHALVPTSPAVEAGDNAAAGGLVTDQRGGPRIVDAEDDGNPVVDIGAYELEAYNHAPIAGNNAYAVDEDGTLTLPAPGVLSDDTDSDSDPLTATLDNGVSNGTLAFNSDGSFVYEPAPNFFGPDSFTYIVNDGLANSNVATVSITVNPVNDAPVADDDAYQAASPLAVPAPGVLANDSDVDGDGLVAVLDTGVSHGTLTLNADGSFTYEPDAGFSGTDSFTYAANDGEAGSNVATVTIEVESSNGAPVAVADAYEVDEDSSLNVSAAGVLANDTDPNGDSLAAALVVDVSHGTLMLKPDGSFSYVPDPDYFGPDSFTYVANDGAADSNEATVNINVRSIIDASIDIAPNSDANRVNLRSNGYLRVALHSTQVANGEAEDFDAAALDGLDTDLFQLGDADGDTSIGASRIKTRDVDHDGDLDLVVDFSIRDLRESGAFTRETVDAAFTADFDADGNVDLEGHDTVDVNRSGGVRLANIVYRLFELFGWL